jgi:hypothetical protein
VHKKKMSCRDFHVTGTAFQQVLHRRRLALTTPCRSRLILTLGLASSQGAVIAFAAESDPWRALQVSLFVSDFGGFYPIQSDD